MKPYLLLVTEKLSVDVAGRFQAANSSLKTEKYNNFPRAHKNVVKALVSSIWTLCNLSVDLENLSNEALCTSIFVKMVVEFEFEALICKTFRFGPLHQEIFVRQWRS
jgi:hypothetical protein